MNTLVTLSTEHARTRVSRADLLLAQKRFKKLDAPSFATHHPQFKTIETVCKPYQKFKNIIVIANGGSRTSALAFYEALHASRNHKHVEFISTMDPSVLKRIKKEFKPADTLIMPISKSGTNIDVLEPLSFFWNTHAVLPVTGKKGSVLRDIALRRGWETIDHPEIGGRFSGRSECAYALLHLCGIDIRAIDRAARQAYRAYDYDAPVSKNEALRAACIAWQLERQGYTEIFCPVYSFDYASFLPLMVQLIHESTGKKGRGQTIFGDLAPESQHHTNQRFFGGRKNVMGLFVVDGREMCSNDPRVRIPKTLRTLPLLDGTLGDLDGRSEERRVGKEC